MKRFRFITRMAGITVCLSVLTACATPGQAYWDAKVKEMCEKDGGVDVYENVNISKNIKPFLKFTSTGKVILPHESKATTSDPYFFKTAVEVLYDGKIKVKKYEDYVIRASDHKILGKKTVYGRIGGDMVKVDNRSYFSCNEIPGFDKKLYDEIFTY